MASLTWPASRATLGLSDDEIVYIDKFITLHQDLLKSYLESQKHGESILIDPDKEVPKAYLNSSNSVASTTPCRSIYYMLNDIFVDADELMGEGNQASAHKYYSPVSGKFYVIKNLPNDVVENKKARLAYNLLKGKAGCVSYHHLDKDFVVEPCYDGTLKEELLGEKFTSTAEKINALAKIAIGVKSIHNTPFKEEWIFESGLRHFSGPLSHRDLKPGNIFVMRDKDGIKIDIGDYGYVAATQYLIRSGYYTPPKLAQILLDRSPTAQENVLYNRSLGMQHDIWQLGLIFASVLKNNLAKGDNGTIPPLPFMLKWMDLPKWDLLKQIVSLTQKEVDDDIQAEINTVMELALPDSEKYALKKCWKVVLHMLQIEPHKRMYIERVEKKLTKSLKTLGGHNWGGMPDILTS